MIPFFAPKKQTSITIFNGCFSVSNLFVYVCSNPFVFVLISLMQAVYQQYQSQDSVSFFKKMRRKLLCFVTALLRDTGIEIQNQNRNYNIWKFIISFILVSLTNFMYCCISAMNINDFYKFITPIPYIAGTTILQSGIYLIYHYRNIIGEIFQNMDNNLYVYPDEDSLQIDYSWYLQEENITVIMTATKLSFFGFLFLITVPTIGEIIYYGRIKTFLTPYWTPWNVDSLQKDIALFLLQYIEAICAVWFNYVTIVFLFVIIIEFVRQYRRLIVAITSLRYRTSLKMENATWFHRELRDNIIHCIRHHQVLIR